MVGECSYASSEGEISRNFDVTLEKSVFTIELLVLHLISGVAARFEIPAPKFSASIPKSLVFLGSRSKVQCSHCTLGIGIEHCRVYTEIQI